MKDELSEKTADPNPIKLFRQWFEEAAKSNIFLHDAMALATVDTEGLPSVRMVLLKSVDERGFVFFTNYDSRKAQELEDKPWAALVIHWAVLQKQVRVEGSVERVSSEISDRYFASRPRESQIGAHASEQSEVISSREELDAGYHRIEKMYMGKSIPRPANWGGYCVKPESIEFWKGRIGRLHDRLLYERQADGRWKISRLAP
jgi:pyridoxamine 5'-phosphate oxidase